MACLHGSSMRDEDDFATERRIARRSPDASRVYTATSFNPFKLKLLQKRYTS